MDKRFNGAMRRIVDVAYECSWEIWVRASYHLEQDTVPGGGGAYMEILIKLEDLTSKTKRKEAKL